MELNERALLRAMFDAAIETAQPLGKFTGRLPERPRGRTIVVGAGKAAANMARAFERAWGPCEGAVVTRYGHGAATEFIDVVEASHPVPDAAGFAAAQKILALAQSAGPDDLVVCVMSGGASALLSLPAPGVTFETKQAINRTLLNCGAPIQAMNAVRRALSAIKGGRLAAAAAPARLVTYLVSDVPGDDPAVIGSGPTIPQTSSLADVRAIFDRYGITMDAALDAAMEANTASLVAQGGDVHMLATPMLALEAAAAVALAHGVTPVILGDAVEGEAREAGIVMAGIARSVVRHGVPAQRPCVLLSGGETTVTLKGEGRGGRNAEFLLALMIALDGVPNVAALACDTDGIDGVEDNAGAWFDPAAFAQAQTLGLDARRFLLDNDSYAYFGALDRLVHTGPTLTNVNDFRAILIR